MRDTLSEELKNLVGEDYVLEQEPMKNHCSFCSGGPVSAFLIPEEEETLRKLLALLSESGAPYYILGNGTNVVFPDGG